MHFGPRLFRIRATGRRSAAGDGRTVTCLYCQRGFEASSRAISLACPHCHRPLNLGPRQIDRPVTDDVLTVGPVRIASRASLVGRLLCTSLVNEGSLDGLATVLGRIELKPDSQTAGQLHARSLQAQRGATVTAAAHITPNPDPTAATPEPAPAATPPSHRPSKPAPTRERVPITPKTQPRIARPFRPLH